MNFNTRWRDEYEMSDLTDEEMESIAAEGVMAEVWREIRQERFVTHESEHQFEDNGTYLFVDGIRIPAREVAIVELSVTNRVEFRQIDAGSFWGLLRSNVSEIIEVKLTVTEPILVELVMRNFSFTFLQNRYYSLSNLEYVQFIELCDAFQSSVAVAQHKVFKHNWIKEGF